MRINTCRKALESKGQRVSIKKTKFMECKFNNEASDSIMLKIEEKVINQTNKFRYLGSMLQSNGDIDEDVTSRISTGWMKWRQASGVLCDKRITNKLKGKFYRTVVRPATLYGAECWALKKKHEQSLHVSEMRMLRWMIGITRKYEIKNHHVREKLGIAPISKKSRENRLRCYGHILRRPIDAPITRGRLLEIKGKR